MKPLNKQFAPKSVMPEKVIQFGEGNFLRAFVDWIIWNMDQKTDFNGNTGVSIAPTPEDVAGFEKYIENYKRCLPIEQAAVDNK